MDPFGEQEKDRATRNHKAFLEVATNDSWEAALDFAMGLSKQELAEMVVFGCLQIRALEWVLDAASITPEEVAEYADSMNRELLKERIRRATKEAEERLLDPSKKVEPDPPS